MEKRLLGMLFTTKNILNSFRTKKTLINLKIETNLTCIDLNSNHVGF